MRKNVKKLLLSLITAMVALGLFAGIPVAAHAQAVNTFADLQTAINGYGAATSNMAITVAADFGLTSVLSIPAPQTAGATLTIKGANPGVTLTRDVYGELFTVGNGAALILEDIVIDGNKDVYLSNTSSIVFVDGGKFTLKDGAILTNNGGSYSDSSVYLNNGTFAMTGGEISGNAAFAGGGVYIGPSSEFSMLGGEISGNTASIAGGGVYIDFSFDNSGEYIDGGAFVMLGGEISGNTAEWGYGGGVYHNGGTFTMLGGEIINNTADYVGGVYIECYEEFILGGTSVINGNANNNVYLADGQYITLSISTPPVPGMHVGVRTESEDGVIVESDAISGDEAYFFADETGREVKYESGQLRIVDAAPDLHTTNLTIINTKRLDAKTFEYEVTMTVKNNGGVAKDVTASLVKFPSSCTIVDGNVSFGDIQGGETVQGVDTLTFLMDRFIAFDGQPLTFAFDYK